jgi:hypothetical protein
MGKRQVTAEWAWISKAPGSHEDYGVLASSAGQTEVGSFAGAYVAGVPSSSLPADDPTCPPWVTFGSHPTSADRQLVSVSAQDPWRGQDQALRPIWPRRFFLCWYDDLAGHQVSFRTLWGAVAPITLPRPDRRPAPIALRPQPLGDLIARIDVIGFERVAAIAAALLDGPVAVTGTADLRLADPSAAIDRLAILDAVAALLPYGFRADASATSAVDNTIAHRMRLVLADYASNGQQTAPLRGPAVTPRSELARDYLTMLAEKEHWEGLDAVVAHLWDAASACSFGRPEAALEMLDELNRHSHKIRAAKNGAEGLKLTRSFFYDEPSRVEQMWRSPEMDEYTRGKLLRPLLEAEDQQVADTLHRHWDAVADEYVTLVNRRLDEGDVRCAMRSLTAARAQPDPEATDRLLRKLVDPPSVSSENWPRGIVTRAVLLRQCPVPVPGTFAQTRAALRRGPATEWPGQLVRELLSGELAADPPVERAAAWVSWLSGSVAGEDLPGWVIALGYALAGPGDEMAQESIRSLIGQDAVWAAIVLSLARDRRRVHMALAIPGLADDLLSQAVLLATQPGQEDTRRMLADAIDVPLWEQRLDPGTIAAIDAARILLACAPANFPDDRSRQEFSRYDEGLRQVLRLTSVRDTRPSLATQFLGQVVPARSRRGLSGGAVWLLQAWSEDERLVFAVAGYAAVPEVSSALGGEPRLGYDFWSRLAAVQPDLRQAAAVPLLRGTVEQAIANPLILDRHADERFGVTGSKLALAMYQACRSGMSPVQIVEVCRDASVEDRTLMTTISHRALDDVLQELGSLLAHPARAAEDDPAAAAERQAVAEEVLLDLRKLICDGALGADYGMEFWRFLDRRLRAERAARKRVRRRLRRRTWPFKPPAPASPERQASAGTGGAE